MLIADVLKSKATLGIVTVRPDLTVAEVAQILTDHGIGAAVVSEDGEHVTGIVSERDVVRHLNTGGAEVLTGSVRAIMTREVHTCVLEDEVVDLAGAMTERRIRHVPVLTDGQLSAIVSIGDVVKSRIDSLQAETEALRDYIQT